MNRRTFLGTLAVNACRAARGREAAANVHSGIQATPLEGAFGGRLMKAAHKFPMPTDQRPPGSAGLPLAARRSCRLRSLALGTEK